MLRSPPAVQELQETWVRGFHGESVVRTPPAMQELQEMWVPSLGREDPLEKGMATPQYSCLEDPRTEEPGGLQRFAESDTTEQLSMQPEYCIKVRQHGKSGIKLSYI